MAIGLFEGLFGGSKEQHADGSVTEKFDSGENITRNSDGTVRESVTHEWNPVGRDFRVTRDGDGNVINAQ